MKNSKKPKVSDMIDARLKSWGFHPYPKALIEVIVPKVEEKMAGAVTDVLKDTKAVALIMGKMSTGPLDESEVKAAKKSKVGVLVVERLKAIPFYPVPDDLFMAVVNRVAEKEGDVVNDVLKDHKALAGFISRMTPASEPPPAPVAAPAGKK